jgi:hypothetical protein
MIEPESFLILKLGSLQNMIWVVNWVHRPLFQGNFNFVKPSRTELLPLDWSLIMTNCSKLIYSPTLQVNNLLIFSSNAGSARTMLASTWTSSLSVIINYRKLTDIIISIDIAMGLASLNTSPPCKFHSSANLEFEL